MTAAYTDNKGYAAVFILERKHLEFFMSVVMVLCACLLAGRGWVKVSQDQVKTERGKRTVVVDAGHGGVDPGKIGVDDSLEKEINLEIAEKLKEILEQQDIEVIMTREQDQGLYEEHSSNKKAQDLKNRCALINEGTADCAVSIHQNSYHEEYVKGAQVFYYGTSKDSEKLAGLIQAKLKKEVDPENTRQAKANESYYLLKKTGIPIVIVECGFLSNWEEAKLLQEEYYQKQLAWAIAMGTVRYLNTR